jgi:tRNA (guanine-N7-)-methyltransferase|tara:strand:+ start:4656 stop:5276 length:621 start_codon:yes stop_codon:yes gene_type:complete
VSDLFREQYVDLATREERIRIFGEECLSIMPERCLEEGLTLEIGCGHGHWLTAYSESKPEDACIGIDLITKRIDKSNRKKEKRNLPYLFFFKTEAQEFLENFPHSISFKRTVLLFPDPWPKKRHHKRRLIQHPFLDLLAARSVPNAELCFRTDHQDYFSWAVDQINCIDSWNLDPEAAWPFEHETFFQNILPEYQTLIAKLHCTKS